MGSLFFVVLILLLFFYVFAIAGMTLFKDNDPIHFGQCQLVGVRDMAISTMLFED